MRQVFLKIASAYSTITKSDGLLLQSATAFLLFNVTSVIESATGIARCEIILQSVTGILKCDNYITKCDRHFKVRQLYYKV